MDNFANYFEIPDSRPVNIAPAMCPPGTSPASTGPGGTLVCWIFVSSCLVAAFQSHSQHPKMVVASGDIRIACTSQKPGDARPAGALGLLLNKKSAPIGFVAQ